MTDHKVVFVAYPSGDPALAETLMDAVRRANVLSLPVRYEPLAVKLCVVRAVFVRRALGPCSARWTFRRPLVERD
jgi:hypothetical protein